MIERAFLIFWGIWLLLILIAAFRVLGFIVARRRQDKKWGDGSANQKPAVVILAAKGFDLKATPRFFDALFAQDYSNYRVIVCFESWSDPVAKWLKEELELSEGNPVWHHPESDSGLKSITLTCAGLSADEGQKVHNQRAAFEQLEDQDEIVAFADADISLSDHWLASLLAPINQGTHPLSTTYRWLVPKRPTLPNQVASVINGSITTQGGSELTNVLWGGSMALSREVFDELKVSELFAGSLNDDLRLSKAARQAGNKIAFVRSLIVPTSIDFTWKSFFEFAKRQYTQVKFFSPILYRGTNFVISLYALGLLSVIGGLIYGYFYAWIPLAAAYVIDQFRGLVRQQIYLSLYQDNGIRQKLFAASWLEHMLTPFWMLIHWIILVSTWTQDTLTWAGIRYRILSKSSTRILDRATTEQALPVGVPGLALLATLRDRKRGTYTQPIRPHRTGPIQPVSQPTEPIEAAPAAEEVAAVAAVAATETVVPPGPIAPTPEPEPVEVEVEPETVPEPEILHPAAIAAVATVSAASAVSTRVGAPGVPLLSAPPAFRPAKAAQPRLARERQRKWNPLVSGIPSLRRKPARTTPPRGTGLKPKTRVEALTIYSPTKFERTSTTADTLVKPVLSKPPTTPKSTPALTPVQTRLDPLGAARFPSLQSKPKAIQKRPSLNRARNSVLRAQNKTRLVPAVDHSRIETPAAVSSPASPPSTQVQKKEEPAAPSQVPASLTSPALLTNSSAARRASGSRRKLRVGAVTRKSAQSGRANHVSPSIRGSRRTRPGSHRSSGRPH